MSRIGRNFGLCYTSSEGSDGGIDLTPQHVGVLVVGFLAREMSDFEKNDDISSRLLGSRLRAWNSSFKADGEKENSIHSLLVLRFSYDDVIAID